MELNLSQGEVLDRSIPAGGDAQALVSLEGSAVVFNDVSSESEPGDAPAAGFKCSFWIDLCHIDILQTPKAGSACVGSTI